ncbi:MAG TPA: glycosyltransferase, partial [Candidatus Limisoma intestinavium]|nr:glycosyltransferase [Candidatus Limisoma intestinavium]
MNPILSIIIPSYNSEKYISKCLDSCVKQDLQPNEYEIIIVNDGSNDRTFEIAQNYASSHCNIKIVTTINQGVCIARNTGMKEAAGEFLWFIDSDDYI